MDGNPKRYIALDPHQRFNLNPTSLRSGIERSPNPTSLRSGIEALRYRVDGYPKRYNVLIEAYVPTQCSGIVRDPKGGPWDPSLLSPAYVRVLSVSPKRGRWGADPLHGTPRSGIERTETLNV